MKTKPMTEISLLLVLSIAWTAKADSSAKHEDKKNDGGDKPRFGVGVSFSPFNTIVPALEIPPLQLADFRVVPLSPVAAADEKKDEFLRLRAMTKPGTQLLVIDHAGAETTGKLSDVRPSGLQLLLQGRAVEIPRQEIAEIRQNGDSLWNGVLLGGAFGAALALDYISHADCQTCSDWEATSVGLILGGGGAALGGLFDYMRRDTRVLYRDVSRAAVPVVRVEPMIKPGGWGLALSWCF